MKCCAFLPLGKCNKIRDKKDSIAASLFSDQTKIESASILYVKFGAIPSQTRQCISNLSNCRTQSITGPLVQYIPKSHQEQFMSRSNDQYFSWNSVHRQATTCVRATTKIFVTITSDRRFSKILKSYSGHPKTCKSIKNWTLKTLTNQILSS